MDMPLNRGDWGMAGEGSRGISARIRMACRRTTPVRGRLRGKKRSDRPERGWSAYLAMSLAMSFADQLVA
jgi:hypothetical protein